MQNQIAVIDNGVINGILKNVDNIPQIDLSIQQDTNVLPEKEMINHGTVCAGIIKKYAPEANIISLKVMPECVRCCRLNSVIDAFKFCINEHIAIVNVSFGTTSPLDVILLGEIVKEAIESGIVIVASGNQYKRVYPAAYESVFYCDVNKRYIPMDDSLYFQVASNGQKAIIASGRQKLNTYNGKEFVAPNHSSFSTPVVTSVIWKIMQENKVSSFKSIYDILHDCIIGKPSVHLNRPNI